MTFRFHAIGRGCAAALIVAAGIAAAAPAGAAGSGTIVAQAGPDWYAIAGAFTTRGNAQRRVNELGGPWYAFWSSECPNFTPGYWIAVAGPFTRGRARSVASRPGPSYHGAYAKSCY